MAYAWREYTAVPNSPLPHSLHNHSKQCDDALQEEVKEQDGGSTSKKSIKDQEHFPCNCHRCRHPKTCRHRREISDTKLRPKTDLFIHKMFQQKKLYLKTMEAMRECKLKPKLSF